MLDFTKKIILEPKWQKRYRFLRALLYVLSIIIAFTFIYNIIFPSIYFVYSPNLASNKITIPVPYNESSTPIEKGVLDKDEKMFMDATLIGNFSDVTVDIELKDNLSSINNDLLSVRKSYQSFLYPTGDPVGFRDGNLLFSNGKFYIISEGKKRQFSSQQIIQDIGISLGMFIIVDEKELNYNKDGEIIDNLFYPNGMLFVIDGNYYQLNDNSLNLFVSEKAFVSRYEAKLATKKDASFLKEFGLADDQIGLADGTLAAIGTSVSILSKEKIYPIYSPKVFEEMGFDWSDVYPVNSEEIGIYKKQKLFYQGSAHPDGTIFKDIRTGNYFIIENGMKHPIIGEYLIQSYLKNHPIIADSASLDIFSSCAFKKASFSLSNRYTCKTSLDKIINEKGNNYQFNTSFNSAVSIDQIDIKFNTALNMKNMKNSLSHIKNSILYLPLTLLKKQ